jgi:glutathione S-transferase
MAPYFARLCVLKHYRGFEIPQDEEYKKWHEWKENVLNHKAVIHTQLKESEYIQVFEKYANGTVRNNIWKTYKEGNKPKWLSEF